MSCVHDELEAALDRWQESHWFVHQVESHYHNADQLRYSMNAFIRSIKEIPQIVSMALQNRSGFPGWHRPIKEALTHDNNLIFRLTEHRDYIVHKSMLVPGSTARLAAVRGRTIKMQFPFSVDPLEDSDHVVERFCAAVPENPILLGILAPDEVQVLTVIRSWRLDGLDGELIAVLRNAWLAVGQYLSDVVEYLGGDRLLNAAPECFRDQREFTYKRYPNIDLEALYRSARAGQGLPVP